MSDDIPKLDPPGAGLPWFERFVAKHLFVRGPAKRTTIDQAISLLEKTGQQALDLVQSIPANKQKTKTLIPRIRGLEDSSRYWSALMTIEHLLITGVGIRDLVIALSQKHSIDDEIKIEDVKPQNHDNTDQLFTEYTDFLDGYRSLIYPLSDLKDPNFTHDHPWFGPLTAHQWLCLNTFHHTLHLKQIVEIQRGLLA